MEGASFRQDSGDLVGQSVQVRSKHVLLSLSRSMDVSASSDGAIDSVVGQQEIDVS